jgi:hypothetical protein
MRGERPPGLLFENAKRLSGSPSAHQRRRKSGTETLPLSLRPQRRWQKTRPHARNGSESGEKCWRPGLVPNDTAKPGFQAHKSYLGNLSYCQSLGQSPKSLGILGTIHLDTQIIRLAKGYIFLNAV